MSDTTGLADHQHLAMAFVLSRLIGERNSDQTYVLCRTLASLGDANGVRLPAPEGRRGGWPAARDVLRRLGITEDELHARWRVIRTGRRRFDDALLLELVPPVCWKPLWNLIAGGPSLAFERIHHLLEAWAVGLEPDGSPRVGRPTGSRLAAAAINNYRVVFLGLAHDCNELRKNEDNKLALDLSAAGATEPLFHEWRADDFPELLKGERLGASPADSDRSAPPFRFVRLMLMGLDYDAEQKIRHRTRRFTALRRRALLGSAVLGWRVGAGARMTGDSVRENYTFLDGVVDRALIINPRKRLPHDLFRPKGIAEKPYEWIDAYKSYARIEDHEPLWIGDLSKRRGSESVSLSLSIVGILDRPAEIELRSNPYYLQIADEFLELTGGRSDWVTRSLSAHTLRHLAEHVAFNVGIDWISERRTDVESAHSMATKGLPSDPQVFADALLDRAMPSMGDRYKDVSSERGRAIWGRVAGLGVYDYMLGERGARRGPDVELVRSAREALRLAEQRKVGREAEIDEIEMRLARPDVTRMDAGERERFLIELCQSQVSLLRLARGLSDASTACEQARADLENAVGVQVPLPDLGKTPELCIAGDQAHADAVMEDLAIVRRPLEVTPDEFRWAVGEDIVPASTLRRWMSGKLPHPAGDPRNLIELDAVRQISERKRVINVDQLDLGRFPPIVVERLEALRRMSPAGLSSRPERQRLDVEAHVVM